MRYSDRRLCNNRTLFFNINWAYILYQKHIFCSEIDLSINYIQEKNMGPHCAMLLTVNITLHASSHLLRHVHSTFFVCLKLKRQVQTWTRKEELPCSDRIHVRWLSFVDKKQHPELQWPEHNTTFEALSNNLRTLKKTLFVFATHLNELPSVFLLTHSEVASFKYAIISSRSLFFLIPAKFILVPGMYFLGFCR